MTDLAALQKEMAGLVMDFRLRVSPDAVARVERWGREGLLLVTEPDDGTRATRIQLAAAYAELDSGSIQGLEARAERWARDGWVPAEISEERRVGKECGYQCRSRWSPYH